MQLKGQWLLCEDGVSRPVIRGELLKANGAWLSAEFIVDTGADRSVLTAGACHALGLPAIAAPNRLGGIGGIASFVELDTRIRLTQHDATTVVFRGQIAAVTDAKTLDICILGRDITDLFAVIVDRPGNHVCLVRGNHSYRIHPS